MNRNLLSILAATTLLLVAGSATADPVETPIGTVSAEQEGRVAEACAAPIPIAPSQPGLPALPGASVSVCVEGNVDMVGATVRVVYLDVYGISDPTGLTGNVLPRGAHVDTRTHADSPFASETIRPVLDLL